MQRLTIFDLIKRRPDSSTSRNLVTASGGYGLTIGSYTADTIKLTERGRAIVERDDANSILDAVLTVPLFSRFFERYRNAAIPAGPAAIDWLKGQGIRPESTTNCFEIIIANGEFVRLIQERSGAKRILSRDAAFDDLAKQSKAAPQPAASPVAAPLVPQQDVITTPTAVSAPHLQTQTPSLHIDIQIHISADAKSEQIEKIFESMAKHLYGRG